MMTKVMFWYCFFLAFVTVGGWCMYEDHVINKYTIILSETEYNRLPEDERKKFKQSICPVCDDKITINEEHRYIYNPYRNVVYLCDKFECYLIHSD